MAVRRVRVWLGGGGKRLCWPVLLLAMAIEVWSRVLRTSPPVSALALVNCALFIPLLLL
jgi:hypothetical protein